MIRPSTSSKRVPGGSSPSWRYCSAVRRKVSPSHNRVLDDCISCALLRPHPGVHRVGGVFVGHLMQGAFHQGGGDGFEGAGDSAAACEFEAADGVDDDAGGVGGIFDGEFHVEF